MEWLFDPRLLRTLEAVVRLGSFAAAGDELGFTQSAISQQVADLERRVGTQVVTRRPVRLTQAGSVLLTADTSINASMSRAHAEITALADGSTGQVRLGAFISAATALVPNALARLRASHPGVHVELVELEQSTITATLLRGDVDLAITFDYAHAPSAPAQHVRRTYLTDDPIRVVLPTDHPLATATSIDPGDIDPDEWIPTTVDLGDLDPRPAEDRDDQRVHRLDFRGQDTRTALSLVAAGLGVTLLPTLALHQPPPGVVSRPMRARALIRRLHLDQLETSNVSSAVTQLSFFLKQPPAGTTTEDRE